MKVFVTGGTGFTGSALCRALAHQGRQVVALDNKPGIFDDELRGLGVDIHIGSVTDERLVNRLTEGCQRLYHLAAAFRLVNLGKKAYWHINVGGTKNVLDAARRTNGARVVNCSTCGVHGNVENPPATEDSPIQPADYYQYTKWEGEKLAMKYVDEGQWVTTVRPAAIYGPGDPERFYLIFRRVARGSFTFLGDGSAYYHPLYIDNLVDALIQAGESDAANGQSYLIADEEYVAIRDLVARTARALDVPIKMRFLPFWPAYAVAALVEAAYAPLPAEPPHFSPPPGLVPAKPGFRYPQGQAGDRFYPEDRPGRRAAPNRGLVSRKEYALTAVFPISCSHTPGLGGIDFRLPEVSQIVAGHQDKRNPAEFEQTSAEIQVKFKSLQNSVTCPMFPPRGARASILGGPKSEEVPHRAKAPSLLRDAWPEGGWMCSFT